MPVGTIKDEALASANLLVALMKNLKATYYQTAELIAEANARGFVTEWAGLDTYTTNPDGSQGATDVTPDPTHRIVGVNMSKNDLNSLLATTATRFSGAALSGSQPEFLSLLISKLPYQV